METRLTQLLGIKYPILQCAMGWVAEEHLVAAVCNAGGLGFLPTASVPVEEQREKVRWIKEQIGNKPFGINASPTVVGFKEHVQMWIDEKIPVWGSAVASPFRVLGMKKPTDVIYIPTIGAPKHGKAMEKEGADAVIAHCVEGGGHPGQLAASVFIPKVSEMIKIPVVAAGGFCDGKGLVAALAMGAEGIAMGTRFALTQECTLPEAVKQRYLKASESDTKIGYQFDGAYCRCMEGDKRKNYRGWWTHPWDVIPDFFLMKRDNRASFKEMKDRYFGARKMGVSPFQLLAGMSMHYKGLIRGDQKKGLFMSGQVVGRIDDIPTCSDLLDRIMREADETYKELGQRFSAAC